MVCQDLEVRRYQKGSEYLHTPYYGQALLLGGTVVAFRIVQCPGGTANYLLSTFLLRIAPRPMLEASVYSLKGLLKSG